MWGVFLLVDFGRSEADIMEESSATSDAHLMATLYAQLFETLRLYGSDGRPVHLGSPKTRALIAYLLLHRDHPSERSHLAFVFWPDSPEQAARRNLRQYLFHAKTALAEATAPLAPLEITSTTVQFNPQIPIRLDVEIFEQKTEAHASLEDLLEALELYSGDLLEDLYEDWCVETRQQLRSRWLSALDRSSQILERQGRIEEAISLLETWVRAEPYQERAHQRLIGLYLARGERPKALQLYRQFARRLADELNTQPAEETRRLIQPEETPAPSQKISPLPSSAAPVFIGRQKELQTLEQAFLHARQGRGHLVLISGEAGIGKTRLLQEYLRRHPDAPLLHSTCYELDGMIPFAPLRQALQNTSLVSHLLNTQPPPPWLPHLRTLLPQWGSATASLGNDSNAPPLRNLLIDLLLALAGNTSEHPLHLILDDLHWADTSTWELLAALARFAPSRPLLIIGLLRLEDFPNEHRPLLRTLQRSEITLTLDLPPLTPEETAALARHLHPKRATNSLFLQNLYRETEGNPFFVIETLRALDESGVHSLKTITPSVLPHSIQRVIEARLERLSATSREALGCAAAFGRSFTFPLLQEVLDIEQTELIACIEEWLQRGLIHESGRGYDFRHDKFRQVAYGSLSRARREYIHTRIAEVLERVIPPVDVTTLAHHYARSEKPLKALPFLIQAGEQALKLRSYHEARQFGQQAVNLLGQLPGPRKHSERIDVNLQLAQAYAFSGDLPRALEIINETEHLALSLKDDIRLGQIYRRAAQFFWLSGQTKAASDYARRTLRVAEEMQDDTLLGAALRMLGRVSIALAAFDDAIAYLLRYVNLSREDVTPPSSPPADLPIVLGYLGVAYARVGAWQRAFSTSQEGLRIANERSEHPQDVRRTFARMQLAMVQSAYHNWNECLQALAPLDLSPANTEITPPLFMALSLYGHALAQSGKPAQGIPYIRRAVTWAERTGYKVFHHMPRMLLAESLLKNGEIEAALQQAQQALSDARQAADRWTTGVLLRLLADIKVRLPKPPWKQIEDDLILSMHLLRQIRARPDLARTYLSLRRLYDRAGQIAWAVDCHFRATTIFEELGMNEELQLAQGQAGRERRGAVVIADLPLQGPNQPLSESIPSQGEKTD
ncbi:MAG: hypothetical protein D6803_02285 [Anaerolineae bacterium]|nr:MAG: hypothetical protein D6803_02285 [Anaerolineae bacterium]